MLGINLWVWLLPYWYTFKLRYRSILLNNKTTVMWWTEQMEHAQLYRIRRGFGSQVELQPLDMLDTTAVKLNKFEKCYFSFSIEPFMANFSILFFYISFRRSCIKFMAVHSQYKTIFPGREGMVWWDCGCWFNPAFEPFTLVVKEYIDCLDIAITAETFFNGNEKFSPEQCVLTIVKFSFWLNLREWRNNHAWHIHLIILWIL